MMISKEENGGVEERQGRSGEQGLLITETTSSEIYQQQQQHNTSRMDSTNHGEILPKTLSSSRCINGYLPPLEQMISNVQWSDELKKYNHHLSCGLIVDNLVSKMHQAKEKITVQFSSELSKIRAKLKQTEHERDHELEQKNNALEQIQKLENIVLDLQAQLEHSKKENHLLKESNKTLKAKETTYLLEIENLKEKMIASSLVFKDMKEENSIMKNDIDVLKLEVQKLQSEKQVLSRELDIQLYRHNLNTGETFDKRVLNIDKGCGITSREKEMELDLLIYRKRLENLTPTFDLVMELAIEHFECFEEIMHVMETLIEKKDERLLLSMVVRNKKFSLFQNLQKDMPEHVQNFVSSLHKEYDRLTQYNSDDEEFETAYNAKEKMCNRILRRKKKDTDVFKHKVGMIISRLKERQLKCENEMEKLRLNVRDLLHQSTPEEYSNATKYYEELKNSIPPYSVLMKDDNHVTESKTVLQYHEQKILSYGEYLTNLQARLSHTKSPSSPPKSLAISHFQKDSGKKHSKHHWSKE